MDITLLKRDGRGRVLCANHKRDLHSIISREFNILEPTLIKNYDKKHILVGEAFEDWPYLLDKRRLGRAIRKYYRNYPTKHKLKELLKPTLYGTERTCM